MIELSEDAALVADVMQIVRARFIEAADTSEHADVQGLRPSKVRSVWPSFPGETIGGHHVGYRSVGNRVQFRPSREAISRADEVMTVWLLDPGLTEEQRTLLVRWSRSLACPKKAGSFRSFCQKSNRSRSTAERSLFVAVQHIARRLLKSAELLQEPDWSRVMPMLPKSGIDFATVADRVAERRETFWRAQDAKPTNRGDLRDQAA